MKKQSKKLMLVAIALLALVALPLVGCKNAAGESHTHSFDETKWKSDATGHWYECSCGEKQEGSFAAHSYGGWEGDANTNKVAVKCTVCGQSREIPDFVYVKGGTVTGSGSDGVFIAERSVTLSAFFMGRHEVTQAEWEDVMTDNKNGIDAETSYFKDSPAGGEIQEKRPVEQVSWYDAVVYCNKRSMKEGLTPCYTKDGSTDPVTWGEVPTEDSDGDVIAKWNAITCNWNANGYRLPTEAEWEYAARGGNPSTEETAPWSYTYAGGNTIDDVAWYSGNSSSKTHEVGNKTANSLGIHDMSGNVWEWCWDWHEDEVGTGEESPVTDPTGPSAGSIRVRRGGSWHFGASNSRVSGRYGSGPSSRFNYPGIRVVRPAK